MSEGGSPQVVDANDEFIHSCVREMQEHQWSLFNTYDRKASGLLATVGMLLSLSIGVEFYLFRSLELEDNRYTVLVFIFFVPTVGSFLVAIASCLLCLNINYFHQSPAPPHLIQQYASSDLSISLVDVTNASMLAWTRNHRLNNQKFKYTRLAFISLANGLVYMIAGLFMSGTAYLLAGG